MSSVTLPFLHTLSGGGGGGNLSFNDLGIGLTYGLMFSDDPW